MTTATPCGHLACWTCLLEGLKATGECVVCRHEHIPCITSSAPTLLESNRSSSHYMMCCKSLGTFLIFTQPSTTVSQTQTQRLSNVGAHPYSLSDSVLFDNSCSTLVFPILSSTIFYLSCFDGCFYTLVYPGDRWSLTL